MAYCWGRTAYSWLGTAYSWLGTAYSWLGMVFGRLGMAYYWLGMRFAWLRMMDFRWGMAFVATEIEAFTEAVRQYRIIITEGAIGEPTPAFPANPAFALPAPAVATGIFERLIELVARIRVAPAYTPEIGALLGIIPSKEAPNAPSSLKPVIKASDSTGGYSFEVDVTRLGMPAYKVQIQRQGSNTWQDAAFATNNPCNVVVTPTTPGQPERILVRAILMKGNEQVGVPSDPTYVTINP